MSFKFTHSFIIVSIMSAALQAATQLSQFGITWTFNKDYQTGQFANGDYWVVGPVTITSIGKPATYQGTIGAMINPMPGYDNGYDSRVPGYKAALDVSLSMPLTVGTNKSLVTTVNWVVGEPGAPTQIRDWGAPRPALRLGAILTVLAGAPPAGSFRPPYAGNDKPIYSTSQLNRNILLNLAQVSSAPSFTDAQHFLEKPWLDHRIDWQGDDLHPSENMPNYGRDMASLINNVSLMLLLNLPASQKDVLLIQFVQLGIDFYGNVKNGAKWGDVGGGIGVGRKWPILMAGMLLNNAEMKNVGSNYGDITFQEDGQTFYLNTAEAGLYTASNYLGYTVAVGAPVWGERHVVVELGTMPWYSDPGNTGYMESCTANGWHGAVLCAYLLNAKSLWNHNALFDYTDWYMKQSWSPAWYRSWSPFAGQMWDTYRSSVGNLPPTDTVAPLVPTNLASTSQTSSSISFSWTAPGAASDGDLASSYRILRNGNQIAQVTQTSFQDTGLSAGTSYNYQVYSVDDAGNQSKSAAAGTFSTSAAPPPSPPPSSGLVGYLRFDKTSGTTCPDVSGNGNSATLLNGATVGVAGEIGRAVHFTAANDAAQIGMTNCIAASGTIAMWVYPESFATAPQYVFGHATQPWANRIQLYLADTAGNLAVGLGNRHSTSTSIQTLGLRTWCHLALTWDGTNYTVYVNGVSKASGAYSGLASLNSFAHIGNNGSPTTATEAFEGRIDEARIYSRALRADEVQNIYTYDSILAKVLNGDTNDSAVNNPPVFNPISSQIVYEGAACTFTVFAVDPDGDAVSYSAAGLPAGAIFNGSTGVFTWVPTAQGIYQITFTASAGQLQTSETINIRVLTQNDRNLADALVLDMRFNDPPADGISDCSIYYNNGTCPSNGVPALVTGKFYSGYAFDGAIDSIIIPSSPSLDVNYVTLAAWVNPSSYTAGQRIISKEFTTAAPSEVYSLRFGRTDTSKIEFWWTVNKVEYTVTSTVSIPLNEWTHVAATYDGSTAILYINGQINWIETGIPGTIRHNDKPVYIGASQFSQAPFNGIIDEVLIYNEALSQAEVQGLLLPANNAPPILASIEDKTVNEGQNLSFTLSATDPDGDAVTYFAINLPAGATLSSNVFSWTPGFTQAGTYYVTFAASDSDLQDRQTVTITVNDVPK
jgi:hypothetical protein